MSSENWIDLTSESGAGPVEEGQSAPTTSQATLPTSSIAPPTAPQQVNPVQDSGAKHTSKLIRVRVGDGEPSSFISHGQPSSGSIVAAAPQTHRTLPPTAGGVSYIQAAMPTTSTSFPIPSIPTVQPPVVYNPQAMGGQPLPPTQLFQNPQIPGIVQPPSQYAFPRPVNVMPPMNPPYNNVLYNNPNANKVYNGDLINSFKANNANLLSVPQIPQQIPQYTPQPQMIAQPRQNPYVLPNPHYQPPRPPQQVAVMAPQPTAFQRNMQMHQHPPQQQTYGKCAIPF